MNKLKMESVNLTEQNIDKIAELFPQVVTEVADLSGAMGEDGKPLLKKAIDFEKLKLMLSAGTGDYVVADDERERYEFTWVGKRQAMIDAATPIRKTLRPCPKESKNWETTENLYIEGDNLEVLKLLQESYLGKVKMIYIDPPYNTGKDFIYKDRFSITKDEEEEAIGMYDDDDNRLFQNPETNGRFHSDWCSMIYSRLQLARNLLTDDGVIFISIDDNEVKNLRNVCDEIFAESNILCQAIWDLGTGTTAGHFTRSHEYILIYARNKMSLPNFAAISDDNIVHGALKKISKANPASEITFPKDFPFDGNCAIFKGELGGNEQEFILSDKMEFSNGKLVSPTIVKAGWGMKRQILDWIDGKETYDSKGQKIIRFYFNKQGILFYEKERGTYNPKSVLSNITNTKSGTQELINLFSFKPFNFPKPSELIRYLILLISQSDDIILDFFSGSASTAHAVMQLNAEDGGHRKFIMVQLPEVCDPNSEAAKAGYKNICEIGKERIRRAGDKIDKERIDKINKQAEKDGVVVDIASLDTGFRVFKLDTTNMKDVYYAAGLLSQKDLWDTVSNIKDDRTDIDLLYGCLLDWGVQLSMPHSTETIDGFTIHTVDAPQSDEIDLIACFDNEVSENVVRTIAKRKPLRVIFRDSSFSDSANKINVFEIFKSISPDTTVKVI